jgi:tRNA(Ile)-lysidine synthase
MIVIPSERSESRDLHFTVGRGRLSRVLPSAPCSGLLYHQAVREKVLHYIRQRGLLRAGDRVTVAVSGGADSVALLRILLDLRLELGVVLTVAHFNHQLRGDDSEADEHFVAELARQHDLLFFVGRAIVREHAAANKLSIEHAARELRYQWMTKLARQQHLDAIAAAHNADDQAETVLMKFLRGAGTRGLAGIHPVLLRDGMRIVRPLLETSRAEIEDYLHSLKQPWHEDHTNRDTRHTRNRVRRELLPLLERDYNPNLRKLLGETAEIARDEEADWEKLATNCLDLWHHDERRLLLQDPSSGRPSEFLSESVALQRRALKCFLERHNIAIEFHHVESVRLCAHRDGSAASLPGGWQAKREGHWLELVPPSTTGEKPEGESYEYFLPLPGRCAIPEVDIVLQATIVRAEAAALAPLGSLLCLAKIGPNLLIRNWQPGDRFRPAHTGSEEKLKRMFSEKRIPADQRALWPVALAGAQVVWVRGFPAAHDYAWGPGSGDALCIEVLPDESPSVATE